MSWLITRSAREGWTCWHIQKVDWHLWVHAKDPHRQVSTNWECLKRIPLPSRILHEHRTVTRRLTASCTHWLPHTTSRWQAIHIAQAKKEMADVENIPRVSYLWNFSFALGNSFISVIHKDVTHASWKGRLSQNKMFKWVSLFSIIDIKTSPTIPAYVHYQGEMCPRLFLPKKWATQPQRGLANETMHIFPQHGFLWKSYQQLCLVSHSDSSLCWPRRPEWCKLIWNFQGSIRSIGTKLSSNFIYWLTHLDPSKIPNMNFTF